MFSMTGIVQKEREGVKLHVTIMNTTFRDASGGEDTDNKQQQARVTFCTQQILEVCIILLLPSMQASSREMANYLEAFYACLV